MQKAIKFRDIPEVKELKAKYTIITIKRLRLKAKQVEINNKLKQMYKDFKSDQLSSDKS